MALVYRGECKSCGTDAPVSEEGYLACRIDSGAIKCLPHPCEDLTLKELGYTFDEATRDKRLVWVTNVVCDTCGRPAKRYDAKPRESCLIYLAIVAVSYALSFTFFSMPLALFIGFILLLLLSQSYSVLERHLVRDAQRLLPKPPVCPNCPEGRYIPFRKASRKKTVCQYCGRREVVYEVWGIS